MITYDISPPAYRRWAFSIDPPVATLTLSAGAGADGDQQPSSVLQADIELADALQRLRFEHPDVAVVVVTAGTEDAFCRAIPAVPAGLPAEIAASVEAFRDEVRCAIEDATACSDQRWLTALNGAASGPGYELALATDEIVLVDDGRSTVGLSQLSGPGELPAGAIRRLIDKRRVRPDRVDELCSRPEGVGARRAADWGLVDAAVPEGAFSDVVGERVAVAARGSQRGPAEQAVELGPLWREQFEGGFAYPNLRVEIEEAAGEATLTVVGPPNHECFAPEPGPTRQRCHWWPLAVCREFDDAVLLLRSNWPRVGTFILRTEGDPLAVASADVALTSGLEHDWFVREVVLSWKRALWRLDRASQSVIALVDPGSCFVGTLLELALAADRVYMVDDEGTGTPAELFLTGMNFGPLPQANGLTRLASRFRSRDDHLAALARRVGDPISAGSAVEFGLVTDAIARSGWERTIRAAIDERARLPFGARAALAKALRGGGPEGALGTSASWGQVPGTSGTNR